MKMLAGVLLSVISMISLQQVSTINISEQYVKDLLAGLRMDQSLRNLLTIYFSALNGTRSEFYSRDFFITYYNYMRPIWEKQTVSGQVTLREFSDIVSPIKDERIQLCLWTQFAQRDINCNDIVDSDDEKAWSRFRVIIRFISLHALDVDTNGDGRLTRDEFKNHLDSVDYDSTDLYITILWNRFNSCDLDKDDDIDLDDVHISYPAI